VLPNSASYNCSTSCLCFPTDWPQCIAHVPKPLRHARGAIFGFCPGHRLFWRRYDEAFLSPYIFFF
jgi:hypothetical protein